MNGRNGNILEGYYSNRNKPDWTLVLSLLGVIATLVSALWYESRASDKEITDLKIKNSKLEWRNEMQKQILEHQYVPDGYRPQY